MRLRRFGGSEVAISQRVYLRQRGGLAVSTVCNGHRDSCLRHACVSQAERAKFQARQAEREVKFKELMSELEHQQATFKQMVKQGALYRLASIIT